MSFMVVMDDFEDNNEEYEAWTSQNFIAALYV